MYVTEEGSQYSALNTSISLNGYKILKMKKQQQNTDSINALISTVYLQRWRYRIGQLSGYKLENPISLNIKEGLVVSLSCDTKTKAITEEFRARLGRDR